MGTGDVFVGKMKFCYFLLLVILPILANAQANQFDEPADAYIINTYVPIPREMSMLMKTISSNQEIRKRLAQQKFLEEQQRRRNFEQYVQLGTECLKKKQITSFLNFAHAALECGYYNNVLYYNMGIAYVVLGKKRKGKKWLKKASESGQMRAKTALYAIKKKISLSDGWFLY